MSGETREKRLADLLAQIFVSSAELQRFLQGHKLTADVVVDINFAGALKDAAWEAVEALRVRALISCGLFENLLSVRPKRRKEISQVARLWDCERRWGLGQRLLVIIVMLMIIGCVAYQFRETAKPVTEVPVGPQDSGKVVAANPIPPNETGKVPVESPAPPPGGPPNQSDPKHAKQSPPQKLRGSGPKPLPRTAQEARAAATEQAKEEIQAAKDPETLEATNAKISTDRGGSISADTIVQNENKLLVWMSSNAYQFTDDNCKHISTVLSNANAQHFDERPPQIQHECKRCMDTMGLQKDPVSTSCPGHSQNSGQWCIADELNGCFLFYYEGRPS